MSELRFLDLFAGIGGFRKGMERAGHKCVGFVEWDKFARVSYEAIHDAKGEWTAHDITSVTDESIRGLQHLGLDVICGGFPCQAFSVAGKRLGFAETRGTLFFEIMRFASILRPQYLFLENVEGLLNHDDGRTFETILATMDELGYDAEWQVFDSQHHGVPQHRERVFIIGHLRGRGTRKVFPIFFDGGENPAELKELTSGVADAHRVYDAQGVARTLKSEGGGIGAKTGLYMITDSAPGRKWEIREGATPSLRAKGGGDRPGIMIVSNTNPSGYGMNGQVYHANGIAPTLTSNKGEGFKIMTLRSDYRSGEAEWQGKETEVSPTLRAQWGYQVPLIRAVLTPDRVEKRQNGRRFKNDGEPMFTLTTQDRHGVEIAGDIRRLTPLECWRLQGFADEDFQHARAALIEKCYNGRDKADSQLYKQAGNSVTVNVIYDIAAHLI